MSNGITRIAWPVALQFSCQTDLDAKTPAIRQRSGARRNRRCSDRKLDGV